MTAGRARAALALICAASALTLVLLGTKLTFFGDDWAFLLQRPGFTADSLLRDHNGHLSVLPVLIYKLLVALFGLDSQLPFRLVLGLSVTAVGVLTYALVSERAGRVAGLVAAALLMFLGPAWNDLLWSFQIGLVGSLATGLGALLALERDTPRRNAAACVLLVLSVALSDLGIPFCVAAAIAIALRRRAAQAWIPLVPLALFGLWFATYGHAAPSAFSSSNVLGLPTYVLDAAASGVASLAGFAREGWFGNTTAWGRPLLGIALAGTLVWFLRGGRPSPRVLIFLGGALTFWVLAGANFTLGRQPVSSRYQLVDAAFLVLIAAELFGSLRPGRRGIALALAITLVAFGSNLSALATGFRFMRDHADNARADLGALEITRATAPPGFRLVEPVAQDAFLPDVTAGRYFAESDAHGSPAWSPREIAAASGRARQAADSVVVAVHRMRLLPASRPASQRGCRRLRVPVDAPAPEGGLVVTNRGADPLGIGVRRFAGPERPRILGALPPGATARIAIPPDSVAIPWHVTGRSRSGRLQVCPA
jgi:hypothetical protein